jgi:hypothetical protein
MSEAAANLRDPADLPAPCPEQLDRRPLLASGWFHQAEGHQKIRRPGTETRLLSFAVRDDGRQDGQDPHDVEPAVLPGVTP